jgi:hypothetical protein
MASRKEQKERARQARLAAERQAAAKAARVRRFRIGLGVPLTIAIVAAIAIAIAAGGGGGGSHAVSAPASSGVKLPAPKTTDLATAVRAAGCVRIDTPDAVARSDQNRRHVDPSTKVNYQTDPPSYGPHYPTPASDGYYPPGKTPATGYLVHAMEHGRVEYQYRPGLPAAQLKQLQALFNEADGQWAGGQLLLLIENQTQMPYAVAATAWGHVLGCKTFNPAVFDALRDFRAAYTNHGPENLGTGPE